jgi:lysophospholipase
VRHSSTTFNAADGLRLHLQAWLPDAEPATVLAVVHGYGEHGGRYGYLGDAMAACGHAVYVYDLRGHGQSAGRRGHIRRFADYLADTRVYLDALAEAQPGAPTYLLGHSLGGLIAAAYAEAQPAGLDGLILSSPFLRLGTPPPASKVHGAKLLSVVSPGFNIGNTLQAADLSHEQDVVEAYVTDPLVHHVATSRWAAEVLSAQGAVLAEAPRIGLPLLLLFSDADAVADPQASRELFAAAGSADKTERRYAGYYHELFNETGRAAVFADVAAWLVRQTPTTAS